MTSGSSILCVARGEHQPLRRFDEVRYVEGTDFERRTLDTLLEEFAVVRRATIAMLEHLPAAGVPGPAP